MLVFNIYYFIHIVELVITCVGREAGRGPLRGEGLWAVGQQWVEVGDMGVLHCWYATSL